MVRRAIAAYVESLERFLASVSGPGLALLGLFALAVVAGLVLYALDREGWNRARGWLAPRLAAGGAWLLVALLLGLELVGLGVVRDGVVQRLDEQDSARYSSAAEPSGGETVQYGPAASLLGERTYSRTLTLPPAILERLGAEGAAVLAPYLGGPDNENLLRLNDTFRRSGDAVVFTRDLTLLTEDRLPLLASDVSATLRFDDASGRGGYGAQYQGTYRFKNPGPRRAVARFVFPLPEGSGTLSGFELRVNNAPVPQPDDAELYVWEGSLAPGATATATVRYRHRGARAWRYDLSGRREPIESFRLLVDADRPAKFLRGSLEPTASERGGSRLRWELNNVITAQSVALAFPGTSRRETLTKLYSFSPLALLLLAGWSLAWALRRRLPLRPANLALALLGFGLGLALGSYLVGYVPAFLAVLLGALVSGALAAAALGPDFALPVGFSAAAPLAFLSVGNAGLLLALVGLAVVASLILAQGPPRRART